ncbi:MAG TPA: non-canonical purine NTP pyrophosphatase [Candidatus Dormibacteraeota bacterium]|nr:non-canonical purine NTP pyrophosphatase [Candidatus Dormibacteraeota bacterium]
MRTLVVATRNPGKLAEFRRLLAGHPWTVAGLDATSFTGEIDEPGPGYRENAVAKATTVCAALDEWVLADDSGIEVTAVRGWPGPRSARWLPGSDADRLASLLDEVGRLSPDDRRARYVAVLAVARPRGEVVVARGTCEGTLVAPRGAGGFGYDPAFLSVDLGKTFAEATPAEKDTCSHRARAVARLARAGFLDEPPR